MQLDLRKPIAMVHGLHLPVLTVVVFKDKNLVDTKVVAVVAVATTVEVVDLVVTVVLVEEADLASIILDLTGQELPQVLQEMVEHLVVHQILIILVTQSVLLRVEQEMMEDMVQYMLILRLHLHHIMI